MTYWPTYLEKSILLLRFKSVGTEQFQTAYSLGSVKTLIRALQEFEHIVDNDGLQINLVLVVQILRAKLNLRKISSTQVRSRYVVSYLRHIDFRVCGRFISHLLESNGGRTYV